MPLFEQRTPEKVVIVVITSNKGLCGAFNANIIKTVNHLVEEQYAAQHAAGNVKLVCIGKKGYEQLHAHYPVMEHNDELLDAPEFTTIASICDQLTQGFLKHEIDKVDIVYNQFLNAATQRLTVDHTADGTQIAIQYITGYDKFHIARFFYIFFKITRCKNNVFFYLCTLFRKNHYGYR